MPKRRPVVATVGVAPSGLQVVPAWGSEPIPASSPKKITAPTRLASAAMAGNASACQRSTRTGSRSRARRRGRCAVKPRACIAPVPPSSPPGARRAAAAATPESGPGSTRQTQSDAAAGWCRAPSPPTSADGPPEASAAPWDRLGLQRLPSPTGIGGQPAKDGAHIHPERGGHRPHTLPALHRLDRLHTQGLQRHVIERATIGRALAFHWPKISNYGFTFGRPSNRVLKNPHRLRPTHPRA